MSRQGKPRPRTIKNVKDFWNKEAQEWGDNPRVTIRDHYLRLLNIEMVKKAIRGCKKALDIGCGTGFSSLFYAEVVKSLVAADYAELMVERAKRFLNDTRYFKEIMDKYALDKKPKLKGNLRFLQGNIFEIQYPDGEFDSVIVERVLVNLPTRRLQAKAIGEIARVLSPGGVCTIAEASVQGHQKIDSLRKKFGLGKMEKYWHNLYLSEPIFEKKIAKAGFNIVKRFRFETYQFLSKIIHPLIVYPAEPEFLAGFNKAAWVAAREFPDFQSVKKIGLETFLKMHFRKLVKRYDPQKLKAYNVILPKILKANPDFTGCSHQILYISKKL